MRRFEVIFYEKESGDVPAEEFLMRLDKKKRAKLMGMIGILQEQGNCKSQSL